MRSLVIVASALVGLGFAACAEVPASAPPSAPAIDVAPAIAVAGLPPPTHLERTMLGPDANNPFFLQRFRDCAAWASYTYCQADLYGGLTP